MTADYGVTATPVSTDLSDADAVASFATRVQAEFKPDMLLANAGGAPPSISTGVEQGWGREGKTLEQVRTEIAASLPIKRYGAPEEFASVEALLVSEPAG